MEFKDRIRILRRRKGVSPAQLAVEFEKSESAIRMWETGRSKPDVDTLIRLAEYFNCTTDYLLGLADFGSSEEKSIYSANMNAISHKIERYPEDVRKVFFDTIYLVVGDDYNNLKINKSLQESFLNDFSLLIKYLYSCVGFVLLSHADYMLSQNDVKIKSSVARRIMTACSNSKARCYMQIDKIVNNLAGMMPPGISERDSLENLLDDSAFANPSFKQQLQEPPTEDKED